MESMDLVGADDNQLESPTTTAKGVASGRRKGKKDSFGGGTSDADGQKKRRCISSACVPCRKRKSKCDGSTPSCSACAAVYNTECVYDPNSDHRRKGVYKKDIDNLKTRNSTLQTLIQAILNYPEEEVTALVHQIRTCESLDKVAEAIIAKENGEEEDDEPLELDTGITRAGGTPTFESKLSGKMGELRLEDGSTRYFGGTSNLIHLGAETGAGEPHSSLTNVEQYPQREIDPVTSWTTVTKDGDLILHLLNMYFCWHYTFFTTLSKSLFYRDFYQGYPPPGSRRETGYCTPLLVNAMLALGCHFTSWPDGRAVRDDPATAGDHFFKEAKRLILEGDLHEVPRLTTVQALALMSVREAGCGREAKGWVYSGMSFRMACDLGLNLDSGGIHHDRKSLDEVEDDARRITFWGCFLFDKCWSNYLGRLPQLPNSIITVPKFEVFPDEDANMWSAYTDTGYSQAHQPARTRLVARQISRLCEISSDLMNYFYNPIDMDKARGKQAELKKLSDIHQRLETWRRELPKELEPKEGGLPSMLVMHMFFQLLYIHLFRPFLKYTPANSPLPSHVSPRKLCTQAAQMISKLLRLYKRSHGLRQICNIAVYIAHSACTIHLLNLPEKNAKRDIIHGVKHLEEIAEGWLCARRTLGILRVLGKKWGVELPEEARAVLERAERKFGTYDGAASPKPAIGSPPAIKQEPSHGFRANNSASPRVAAYNNIPVQAPAVTPTGTTLPDFQLQYGNPDTATVYSPDAMNTAAPPSYARYTETTTTSSNPHSTSSAAPVPSLPSSAHHPSLPTNGATPAAPSPQYHTNVPSPGAPSPSQFFGGVVTDQLVRESQDWWLRDQSQLAVGFDNWNLSNMSDASDFAWLNGSSGSTTGTGTGVGGSPVGTTHAGGDSSWGGGPVGGPGRANGNANGMNGARGGNMGSGIGGIAGSNGGAVGGLNASNGMNLGFGVDINGYGGAMSAYDEAEWYQ